MGRSEVLTFRQFVGKLVLKILSNLGRIIFLQIFLETLLKMPFSSATTWGDYGTLLQKITEITPQNAAPIGYHLEKHPKDYSRSTHKKLIFAGYHLREDYGQNCFLTGYHLKRNFLHRVRKWQFLLEVYEDCFQKTIDNSLLNVLTSRGIFLDPVDFGSLKFQI